MIRLIPFLVAFIFIFYKIYKINKQNLCAKAFIFITEINKNKEKYEANYKANLFDFFKKDEAKKVFKDMNYELVKNYDNKKSKMVFRAVNWGFFDTHTKQIFKKRKVVRKILEHSFLTQDWSVFSGNASKTAKENIAEFWDINATEISFLNNKVAALKLLLEGYKKHKKEFYKDVAMDIANQIANKPQELEAEDLNVLNEWNKISKPKKK